VAGQIALNLPTADLPEERLRLLSTAARLWPDQRAETAVALRGRAVLSALRLGRVRTAARLAAGLPFRPTWTFATRTGPPILVDLVRRRLGEFRGRGQESADVLAALGGRAGKD
jgi:hypothetical protein